MGPGPLLGITFQVTFARLIHKTLFFLLNVFVTGSHTQFAAAVTNSQSRLKHRITRKHAKSCEHVLSRGLSTTPPNGRRVFDVHLDSPHTSKLRDCSEYRTVRREGSHRNLRKSTAWNDKNHHLPGGH